MTSASRPNNALERVVRVVALYAAAFVAACASTPVNRPEHALERPGPNEALVHLYRPMQTGTDNPPIEFFLDERAVARLDADRFTTIRVPPGRHRVMGRAMLTFTERWLPPAEFEAQAGRSYFIYPVAITRKEDWSSWKPLALAAGVAVITRGTYFLLPGASANVSVGHYWQLADDATLDANVDRMKRAEFVRTRQLDK